MNKFLDLLDSIREGAPTPLGFGASRAQKLPGIALIGMVANDHKKTITLSRRFCLRSKRSLQKSKKINESLTFSKTKVFLD